MEDISKEDVKKIIDELMSIPLGPGDLVKDAAKDLLRGHVERAIDALERGDNIEAAQAVAQTIAVSAAWVAGTAFGWSTKLPLAGLDLVFQSFRKQGFMGKVLEHLGVDSAYTRQKILNVSKGLVFGAAFAYGVNNFINLLTNRNYLDAKGWRAPIDPLMLDLDGDGLELRRVDGQILFDHDGDGIKTGTGWLGADDGILVRDVNGDGRITSGL
ncbi:hypothetical protein, partial [Comamonas guangdongensis]